MVFLFCVDFHRLHQMCVKLIFRQFNHFTILRSIFDTFIFSCVKNTLHDNLTTSTRAFFSSCADFSVFLLGSILVFWLNEWKNGTIYHCLRFVDLRLNSKRQRRVEQATRHLTSNLASNISSHLIDEPMAPHKNSHTNA